ncbi:hypothetical protein A4X13_0g3030 [Tilletia indica]|uniref:WD repeat-containing protein 44 n=1 Tax=Tilletia indica TaxID=43049 RepID=A0A177TRL6_9BASI|nr:hypothetical protein A4X13_0g3030 [Tilletia indica]
MDRSKTPTPAAILQQAQQQQQQKQEQQQQQQQSHDETEIPPRHHQATTSETSSGAVTPSAQQPQSSTSFFGWVRSAIAPINPLSAVLSGTTSSDSPQARSSTPDRSARSHQHRDEGDDHTRSGSGATEDDYDETAKKMTRASRRKVNTSVASSSATDLDTTNSDGEDSGCEEIFTPFHQVQAAAAHSPHRAQSPVSPSNALKRLPFANHMRRSSSPASPVPGTVAAAAASATATVLNGLPSSAQAGGALMHSASTPPAPGGPRLFKPFARREALVLDESTPLDELDQSSSSSSPQTSSPAGPVGLRALSPSSSRSGQLPSLILTPPDPRQLRNPKDVSSETSSLMEMLQDGSQQSNGQQLSPDASFELESLEKIRIDMETPDNTNQHREMVAFGQAVADMRATPKPFSNSNTSTPATSSPEEEEHLGAEVPPVDSRATPKPNQQMRSSQPQAQQQQQSSTKSSSSNSTTSSRSRNIFRRSHGAQTLELNTSERRDRAAPGNLSPSILAESDEPMEELGTPVSVKSPADIMLPSSSSSERSGSGSGFANGRHSDVESSRRTASERDISSPASVRTQESGLLKSAQKVSRSASSSGSFWKFNRSSKKRPTSGSSGGVVPLSDDVGAADVSSKASSSSTRLSIGGPDSSSSSIFSYDGQNGSPLPGEFSERRGSILSIASSSGGGSRTGPDGAKLRVSIDEANLPIRSGGMDSEFEAAEPVHRRVRSVESFRSALGKGKSSSRKSNASSSVGIGGAAPNARPGSVMSVGSLGTLDKGTVKEAGKLSVKLWPKAVKTRFRGKASKEREFERLVLAQELYLGWDPIPRKRRPSEATRRLSYASSIDSGQSHGPVSGPNIPIQSPSSTHSGSDPMASVGSVINMNHSASTSSVTSSVSSSSASGGIPNSAGLPPLAGSVGSMGTASSSRPNSIKGSTSGKGDNNGSNAKPHKSTWAMRFSVDGRYFAVAGQDCVVRVFEVLSVPEQRQAEVDAALLATGHGLGAGGSATSLGSHAGDVNFASGTASTDNFAMGATAEGEQGRGSVKSSSSSRSARKAAKAQANATNRAIPVFSSKPIREFRGHSADVIDLSWSKNNFLMSASTDKTARLWHVTRPECLCTFGHMDFVTGACFHPTDDRFFLSASLDGKLRLWNIPAKKVQYSADVPGLITACAFTASGKMACAGTFGGAIVMYHTDKLAYATSIAVRSTSSKSSKGSKITGIEPVPNLGSNHERILVSSNDSRIRIYDLGDKSVAHKFKASGYHNKESQIRASISTDGMYITAGSEDASVYVWDAGQGKAYGGLRGKGNKVSRNATKQFAEAAHEYWHTTGGAVTCSVVAPLLTHKHLDASEDPIMRRSWRHEIEQARTASSRPLSSLTLSSAISAALPIAFRGGPGRQQVNAKLNRIVVTADDTSCVQVWRTDSFDLLGSIMQPMVPKTAKSVINNSSSSNLGLNRTSSGSSHGHYSMSPPPGGASPALGR